MRILGQNHRLGVLAGLPHEERVRRFQSSADRQLLVAMIEAISGERFEEKVYSEWNELNSIQKKFYAMIAIATSNSFQISQPELLLAAQASTATGDVEALKNIADKKIVYLDSSTRRYRTRHRVLAEELIREIQKKSPGYLSNILPVMAWSISNNITSDTPRDQRQRRFLTKLLNHDYLMRLVGLDGARELYSKTEELLAWDYHYWLQRGSLEIEEGSIREAENFINQASRRSFCRNIVGSHRC